MFSRMIIAHRTIIMFLAEAEATLEDEPDDVTKIQNTVCVSDPRPLASSWKDEQQKEQKDEIR